MVDANIGNTSIQCAKGEPTSGQHTIHMLAGAKHANIWKCTSRMVRRSRTYERYGPPTPLQLAHIPMTIYPCSSNPYAPKAPHPALGCRHKVRRPERRNCRQLMRVSAIGARTRIGASGTTTLRYCASTLQHTKNIGGSTRRPSMARHRSCPQHTCTCLQHADDQARSTLYHMKSTVLTRAGAGRR